MPPSSPWVTALSSAALFQLLVSLGLAALCAYLERQYRQRYFGLWAGAWSVYALRVAAVRAHVATEEPLWLFWQQALSGWAALALLWASLVFTLRLRWRAVYALPAAIPPLWAGLAVARGAGADAVGPMVVFLSAATAAASWAFFRHGRLVGSGAARFLGAALALWTVYHFFDPLVRARSSVEPWAYHADAIFELAVGLGILLLVLEDLGQGLGTLTALSGELQVRPGAGEKMAEAMLRRALSLRGVQGSALWVTDGGDGRFVQGSGVAALWAFEGAPPEAKAAALRVRESGLPEWGSRSGEGAPSGAHGYTAALPILREDAVVGALVVVGEARDPFTVLDDRFLLAFGHQVGAALANEELTEALRGRTAELERLQERMVHQHEEERQRLWRALHDETAQVLAALNLQLGVLEEGSPPGQAPALERAKRLLAEGIRGIRSVTRGLRPRALDDLGLVPAMRALTRDFDGGALQVRFEIDDDLPPLPTDAEAALYRSLQETLANAARHGGGTQIDVSLGRAAGGVRLTVVDDGGGFPADIAERLRGGGGLSGIRERVTSLGGSLDFGNVQGGGARVKVEVPAASLNARGGEADG